MEQRLKELRKTLGLTQKELGEKIGLTNFTISDIEKGKRTLTERNKNLLCEKLNINKEWLETGIGEMFNPSQPADDFNILLSQVENSEDEFLRNFLWTYWQLDEKSKQVIRDFTYALAKKQKKESEEKESRCENAAPAHLMPVAAHNDHADDPEELERMKRDLDKL